MSGTLQAASDVYCVGAEYLPTFIDTLDEETGRNQLQDNKEWAQCLPLNHSGDDKLDDEVSLYHDPGRTSQRCCPTLSTAEA